MVELVVENKNIATVPRLRVKKRTLSQRMIKQKLMGLTMLVISVIVIMVLSDVPPNSSPEEMNGIGLFFTIPYGIGALFSKKYILMI